MAITPVTTLVSQAKEQIETLLQEDMPRHRLKRALRSL